MDNYQDQPVKLLQKLIRFNTTNPPGNEKECIEFIRNVIEGSGIETKIFAKEANRPNLVARIKGKREKPPLLLYGHVDVVTSEYQQWDRGAFSGDLYQDCIWGRGAADMKGGLAMMVSTLLKIKKEGVLLPFDVIFLALCDEEVDGELGAQYMVEEHAEIFKDVRYAISEFGGFRMDIDGVSFYPIQVAEKQGCGLEMTVHGPAGHGATIQQGGTIGRLAKILSILDRRLLPVHITDSAMIMIAAMAENVDSRKKIFLSLCKIPLLTNICIKMLGKLGNFLSPLLRNTVNITLINGGNSVNVIPSEISMNADVRILPGFTPQDVIQEIRDIYTDEVLIDVVYNCPNPAEKPDMGLYEILAGSLKQYYPDAKPIPYFMAGVTDARFFNRLGIQTYGFTPISFPDGVDFSDMMHAANERVTVKSIEAGYEIIYNAIMEYTLL